MPAREGCGIARSRMVSVSSMMNEHESGRGGEGAASWAFLSSLTESAPDEEAYGAINVEEGSGEGGRAGDTLTS